MPNGTNCMNLQLGGTQTSDATSQDVSSLLLFVWKCTDATFVHTWKRKLSLHYSQAFCSRVRMFRFLGYYKWSVAFEVTVEESNCQLVLVDLWGVSWLIIVLQYDSLSIKRHSRRWSMPFKNAVLLLLSHSVVHDWLWIRKVSSPLLSLSPYIHRSVNAFNF